jgi:peptidoglycan/LPS O-acetylase OafA/YrhL
MKKPHDSRLLFLDLIRAIAALSVLLQHTLESQFKSFKYFSYNYFQLGQFGVILFFLCSGFIIIYTLQNVSTLKEFAIRRLFRIYPLYFFSFMIALLFLPQNISLKSIVFNLIIMGHFIHNPFLGLYWTLSYEVIFYIIVSVLWRLDILKRFNYIIVALCLSMLIMSVLHKPIGMLFNFLTFFVGVMSYYNFIESNNKTIALYFLFLIISIIISTNNSFIHYIGYNYEYLQYGSKSFIAMSSAWCVAYIVFYFVCRTRLYVSRFLTFFGVISYSIYLNQALVLSIMKFSNIFLNIAITLLASMVTYFVIEKPFINYSRRLFHK